MRAIPFLMVLALATSVEARKWTDVSGTYSIEAEFVGVSGEQVLLRSEDGKQLKVPLAKLSKADQVFVRSQVKGKAKKRSLVDSLQTKSKLEFTQTPIRDVLQFMRQTHGVPMFLDEKALEEVGVGPDLPVTVKGEATLAKHLDALGKQIKLTWLITHDVIYITTADKAETMLQTRVYRLNNAAAAAPVKALILKQIAPQSWDAMGGPGAIVVLGKCLVVSQQRVVHEQIAALKQDLKPVAVVTNTGKATPLSTALAQPVTAQFLDTPLEDVIKFFAAQTKGVKIRLNAEALENVGLGTDTPINANISPIPLRSSLTLILGELGLTWTYEGNDIVVTTPEAAEQKLITMLHDVKGVTLRPGTADGLIRVLTKTVSPSAWDAVGGPGSIKFSAPASLKVAQTRDVHERIARLLATLRTVK